MTMNGLSPAARRAASLLLAALGVAAGLYAVEYGSRPYDSGIEPRGSVVYRTAAEYRQYLELFRGNAQLHPFYERGVRRIRRREQARLFFWGVAAFGVLGAVIVGTRRAAPVPELDP